MKLSIGIVGLPNVGKSTLFKKLTDQEVHIANYPFATIDPNVGIVPVPDERLEVLTKLSKSEKTIPAVVEFYDIAGLVKGANKGEGLGNQFLNHIKEVQAIVQVVRCFESGEIIHVESSVDPIRDIEIINAELALKDLEIVERALERAEADGRAGKKEAREAKDVLEKVQSALARSEAIFEYRDHPAVRPLNLLMAKKQIYLLNGKESDISEGVRAYIKDLGADFIIADLSAEDAIPGLIRAAYRILDLLSFFTTGEKETRAWTIRHGAKAPEAAGAIHTDFEQKFIRAEVVATEKLVEAGGWSAAKQKGWLRIEGKEYEVQDGDVLVIRHG